MGHKDRDINYEIERQKIIEKKFGCKFIRVNPDKNNYNIFKTINEIRRYIKKSTKRSLIGTISKRLLE